MKKPDKLSPKEVVEVLRTIMTAFRLLAEADETPVAGVIFTANTFDSIKRLFGPEAHPYVISGINADPSMDSSFVVAGILCLRGTPINEGGESILSVN